MKTKYWKVFIVINIFLTVVNFWSLQIPGLNRAMQLACYFACMATIFFGLNVMDKTEHRQLARVRP